MKTLNFASLAGTVRRPENVGYGARDLKTGVMQSLAGAPQILVNWLARRPQGRRPLLLHRAASDEVLDRVGLAIEWVERQSCDVLLPQLYEALEPFGLYPGWGDTGEKVAARLRLFQRVLSSADADALAALLPQLPLVVSVVLPSVHGYFAQANVLGKPDTGGQVVYVLQQARALGQFIHDRLVDSGVVDLEPQVIILTRLIPRSEDTTTDVPLEPVQGSDWAVVLRVPFRTADNQVVEPWISRFQIWPYLRRYAQDAEQAIRSHLQSRGAGDAPDLILGHYTDGNLVAMWLSQAFDSLQGFVPHAFEKMKYERIVSEQEAVEEYGFHVQWLVEAAYLSMSHFGQFNSHLEIAGRGEQPSQIQPYRSFGFPGRYEVTAQVGPEDARLNVNPPGTNTDLFFPYTELERRRPEWVAELRRAVFEAETTFTVRFEGQAVPVHALGRLDRQDRAILLSAARPDRVKNLEALVAAFANSSDLQACANLVIVTGDLSRLAEDAEEAAVMNSIVRMVKEHGLLDRVRLLPSKVTAGKLPVMGELYRVVAEGGGVFVQPALYEGFGLTVIEAMACGLPVVATRNGGPSEIVEDGENGLLIDPTEPDEIARQALRLVGPGGEGLWCRLSEAGIERVRSTYVWPRHVGDLLDEFYPTYSALLALRPEIRQTRSAALDDLTGLYTQLVEE